MNDEDVGRLANIVSERVFESMAKFVDVIEGVVRENEMLRTKVAHLELMIFGRENDEDDEDDDDDYEPVPDDELDVFFDADGVWEPEEDDSEPTFD